MKRLNRVRHGRRQQFINLPPSGLGETGNDRTEDGSRETLSGLPGPTEERGGATGYREDNHRHASWCEKALKAELKRHGYSQAQELWQDIALSWIAADPDERARRLIRPDAPAFEITQRLARQFEEASRAELQRDPGE